LICSSGIRLVLNVDCFKALGIVVAITAFRTHSFQTHHRNFGTQKLGSNQLKCSISKCLLYLRMQALFKVFYFSSSTYKVTSLHLRFLNSIASK
jgi:hypothetical protein